MLIHIVLFKLIDRSTENVQKVAEVLRGMEGKIPQLLHLEVGIDALHSERSYDVALFTKFASIEDMQAYQIHPVHVEVAKYIMSVRESSVTVDYNSC